MRSVKRTVKRAVLAVLLLLCALWPLAIADARPLSHPSLTWMRCVTHATHTHCTRYPLHGHRAYGFWSHCTGAIVRVCVRYPYLHPRVQRQSVRPVVQPASYSEPMLVTYYLATGYPMANGVYPSVGWAACGFDLTLGTRVSVPGIGTLTCGDRIGYQPWHHIDVFGIPLGSGVRLVTVYR